MQDCVFCKIVSGQIPSYKVYENQNVLAFLDIGPINQGHTLIVPKQHFEFFDSCPKDILADVMSVASDIAKAVKKVSQADGYNVLCNNGRVAGQLVEHLHFHIIPRFAEDSVFNKWPAKQYKTGQAEEIAEKIRSLLVF